MGRRSLLQLALLAELKREPAKFVASLACRVGRLRPAVSRSLARLREEGLVTRETGQWRLTDRGEKEAATMTKEIQRSVSSAAAAVDRALIPLRSIADEIARNKAAQVQHLFEPMEHLANVQRILTEELVTMDVARKMAKYGTSTVDRHLQAFTEAQRLAKYLTGSHLAGMHRHVASLAQDLVCFDALVAERAQGVVLDTLPAISEALKAANLDPTDRLKPFWDFEDFLRRQGVLQTIESVSRHMADTALASLPFHSLPWNELTGLLSIMEAPHAGASVTWRRDQHPADLHLAMLRRASQEPSRPILVIEADVACFLCGEPLATQNASFEWLSEAELKVTLPTIPVCVQCLRTEPRSYLDRLVEALEQPARGPRFEILQGGGEDDGRAKGRDHLRLVKRDVDTDESEDR